MMKDGARQDGAKHPAIGWVLSTAFVLVSLFASCVLPVEYPPGVLVAEDPVQKRVTGLQVFEVGDFLVRPLAHFSIEARVLSRKRYRMGRDSDLSPVDLALGWGAMSDQAVLDRLEIWQGGRFFYWRTGQLPIPEREVIEHSSNMHMIPAEETVRDALLSVREGDLVEVEGYLVVATAEGGWIWRSSLSRKDSGNGACELVYVTRIEVR